MNEPSEEVKAMARRIAADLKPMQRAAMIDEAARTDEGLELRAHLHPGRRCSLQRQGLLVDRMYSQVLTPLGLAVRAALSSTERQSNDR